jgi:hypothetical protein
MHFNPSNAKLNPICHLLALLGAHHILHVSRTRVKIVTYSRFRLHFSVHSEERNIRTCSDEISRLKCLKLIWMDWRKPRLMLCGCSENVYILFIVASFVVLGGFWGVFGGWINVQIVVCLIRNSLWASRGLQQYCGDILWRNIALKHWSWRWNRHVPTTRCSVSASLHVVISHKNTIRIVSPQRGVTSYVFTPFGPSPCEWSLTDRRIGTRFFLL